MGIWTPHYIKENYSCHSLIGICDYYSKMITLNVVLFTIVLYWMVDYCWLIIVTETCTLIEHDHNMLCLLVCQ